MNKSGPWATSYVASKAQCHSIRSIHVWYHKPKSLKTGQCFIILIDIGHKFVFHCIRSLDKDHSMINETLC